jgi:hypothetical protein
LFDVETLRTVMTLARDAAKNKKRAPPTSPTFGQSYKTFYGQNLQIFIIKQCVCPWEVFKVSLIYNLLHLGRLQPYPETVE